MVAQTAQASASAIEARKRLLRDLKEIHSNPLENVTAAPINDNNLFTWHANLRGVDSEMKETFHFMLEFPQTYPINPPHVTLCTPLPHPNVFPAKDGNGFSLCMDMLEQGQWAEDIDKNVKFSGWSSSYSVQLVLVQLQSFLLDAQLQYSQQKGTLTDALAKAKSFSCKVCPHKPALPFPAFPTAEQFAARTVVKVRKFVPHPHASHMYHPQSLYRSKPALTASTPTPTPTTTPTTAVTATPTTILTPETTSAKLTKTSTVMATQSTQYATQPKLSTPPPPSPSAPLIPPPPPKPEWTVVQSKRFPASEPPKQDKQKQEKKAQKKATKKLIAALATNGMAAAGNGKTTKPKKTNDKPAKALSVQEYFDSTPAAPVKKNTSGYEKDYVALMLQDAAEREALLRERALREKEELKKEKDKQRKQAKKAAAKLQLVTASAKSANATKEVNGKPATGANTKRTNKVKNSDVEVEKVQEVPKVEHKDLSPVKQQKEHTPSWADDDSWEEQMPAKGKATEAVQKPEVIPEPASVRPPVKLGTAKLTHKQLRDVVKINHDMLGHLQTLPMDILLHTFSYLNTAQVSRLALVSVDMHKVTENGILWRELFSKYYPKSKLTAGNIADWKYVFMREVDHIMDELTCFHTKTNFEEDVLGIPIKFSVNPVTEKVDYIGSTLDILSSTAFNKHAIRKSPYKEDFTHFLPLYITEEHFQRALPEIKKALVALSPEYRTTGFNPLMVLSVFPKLMNTMIVLVMDGGLTASIKALTGYFAIHRLLLAFIELYPQLMAELNSSIAAFIKSEDARVKSQISSIGDWLPLISVSNKYSWNHVAKAVIGETFDRNVIWICKQDPSLSTLADINKANANNNTAKPGVEQHRLTKSFEATEVSLKLILFHVYFLTRVARPPGVSLAQIADNYDRYYGRPNSRALDSFFNAVKKIKGMRGWPDFFLLSGLPCPTPAALTTTLRENVRNSKKKKYHNDMTNFRNIQASGTSVILKKGDNFSAPTTLSKVVMGLGWGCEGSIKFLDASCFEFTKEGKMLEFVDYAHTSNANGSISHSGDVIDQAKLSVEHTINIGLPRLRSETATIMFTITAYQETLTHAKMPWVRLSDGETNQELCRYVLEKTGSHTAVIMCKLSKNQVKKCWDLKVIGKFDEGRASSYNPILQNMETQLKKGEL